ncbi:hypothetical protein PAE9249_02936 [Paenibacillus sp. CECT 9249]|uniref:TadE/TadG family type IV pilus assembly protein n=1 Tax=Paenibacillus sp. CECT 9249 TaxID=2845385 RepID=UPI001E49BAFD|nr:TadE family protein [Paenibacillus sp. CECT 9249]CAH0120417.1 hypothetical protein PAE9249_02936 [Paenibacillus sp. CECT 9249]
MKYRWGWLRREDGGMVVEAAMALPVFLMFVVFLVYIVQMSFITMALQMTAAEATKQVAAHFYPVMLAFENREEQADGGNSGVPGSGSAEAPNDAEGTSDKLSAEEVAESFDQLFPPPIGDWIRDSKWFRAAEDSVHEAFGDAFIKPFMKPFVQEHILEFERIRVSRVRIPILKKDKKDPYFALELSYKLPMKVPLLNRDLVLRAKAEERVWIGDISAAGRGDDDGEGEKPQIVSLEPNPLLPGRKAKLTAKIAPGGTANLTVYYKSGVSVAKHLGMATADGEGYVVWEWHVSGNTTPGMWNLAVEAEGGGRTEMAFDVRKKNDGASKP